MECDNIASPGVPGFANLRMAPRSLEEILPQINPGHGRGPEPAAHRGENAGNSAARYTGRQPVDQTEIVPPGLRLNSVRRRSAADREFWRLNGAVSKTSGGVPSSVALSPFVTQRLGFRDPRARLCPPVSLRLPAGLGPKLGPTGRPAWRSSPHPRSLSITDPVVIETVSLTSDLVSPLSAVSTLAVSGSRRQRSRRP
jgi:hypothetical protein